MEGNIEISVREDEANMQTIVTASILFYHKIYIGIRSAKVGDHLKDTLSNKVKQYVADWAKANPPIEED